MAWTIDFRQDTNAKGVGTATTNYVGENDDEGISREDEGIRELRAPLGMNVGLGSLVENQEVWPHDAARNLESDSAKNWDPTKTHLETGNINCR